MLTNGTITAWFHLLRIKVLVGHAGHSQQLVLCNHTGTFLEKEEILPSLNNNLLIVLEILITTVAMVVYHLMLLSISDILEDFKLMLLTHMLQKLIHVSTDHKFQLLIADTEASTSLKVMKSKWQKDSTTLDLFQSPSKLLQDSRIMQEVSTVLIIVERLLKMSTTQSWQQDLDLKMERSSGILKIHGVLHGELKDILKWKEMLICALLPNATHILLLTISETLTLLHD